MPAATDDALLIVADTPVIAVEPRAPGRNPLMVPELEYNFVLKAGCPDDQKPESLLLSIADVRHVFPAAELGGDLAEVRLTVPARQLAPIVLDNFCVVDPARGEETGVATVGSGEPLTITAVLMAHASLRCADDNEQSMRYVSIPLDIQLRCAAGRDKNAKGTAD